MYNGDWIEDQGTGKGNHIWINGDVYKGQFLNCLKDGYGEE